MFGISVWRKINVPVQKPAPFGEVEADFVTFIPQSLSQGDDVLSSVVDGRARFDGAFTCERVLGRVDSQSPRFDTFEAV